MEVDWFQDVEAVPIPASIVWLVEPIEDDVVDLCLLGGTTTT